MTKSTLILKTSLVIALALALSITKSFGQSPEVIDTPFDFGPDTGAGVTGTITFSKFDTSLGTLQEVDLQLLNVTTTGSLTITNVSSVNQKYYNIYVNGDYVVSDGTNTVEATPSTGPDGSSTPVNSPSGTKNITPGNSYISAINSAPVNSTETQLLLGTNDLSSYETSGTGSLTVSLNGSTGYSVGISSGNANESVNDFAAGEYQVTYIYTTSVPEPSKTAIIMLGFGVCVLFGRKYLKKNSDLTLS